MDLLRNKKKGYHPRPFRKSGHVDKKIRLLNVLPYAAKDDSAPIQCHFLDPCAFSSKFFKRRVIYTALSYRWGAAGTSADLRWITIDGRSVCVRRNLWSFLHTMAVIGNEGPFWIDALCIDQLNDEEKARQITLMPRIYENAAIVLVWLGMPQGLQVSGVKELHNLYLQKGRNRYDKTVPSEERREGLKFIVENQYWARLWIVQEIFLAKSLHVYTGPTCWSISQLEKMRRGQSYNPAFRFTIDWMRFERILRERAEWKNKKLHLHNALYLWSGQECHNMHDKVYALLGLVPKTNVKIDYGMELTELFRQVLRSERKKIFAHDYAYAEIFADWMMSSLGLRDQVKAQRISKRFLLDRKFLGMGHGVEQEDIAPSDNMAMGPVSYRAQVREL